VDAPAPRSIAAPVDEMPEDEPDTRARDIHRSGLGAPEVPGSGEATGERAGDRTRPIR